MGTRTVLDTNIYLSALRWGGNPAYILELSFKKKIIVILSFRQLDELQRVLAYERFGFTEIQQEQFLQNICAMALMIPTPGKLRVIQEDPSDNIILESAIIGDATRLITGDRHLLSLKSYNDVVIMTPAEFMRERVMK